MTRKQRSPTFYNGPEHESLLAIGRCLWLHFGQQDANRRVFGLLQQFKVVSIFQLSPFGANFCRKVLEKQLPLYGDFSDGAPERTRKGDFLYE